MAFKLYLGNKPPLAPSGPTPGLGELLFTGFAPTVSDGTAKVWALVVGGGQAGGDVGAAVVMLGN